MDTSNIHSIFYLFTTLLSLLSKSDAKVLREQNKTVRRRDLKMMAETITLMLVNLAGVMERADESLLPGVYKEVGAALHIDPTGLGSLTLFRSIVQGFCYPLGAYLANNHNRTHVISLGAFLWAAATFIFAFSSTFFQAAVSRALNGIGLAIVIPSMKSLVADLTDDNNRGTAFGWLQVTGNIGAIIGNLCSVLMASTSFMGISGWRISFHLVGMVSVIVGILVRQFATDPHFPDDGIPDGGNPGPQMHRMAVVQFVEDDPHFPDGCIPDGGNPGPQMHRMTVEQFIEQARLVMGIQSFQIIVAQGVTGSIPWSALSFAPMLLELIGFSHKQTASLMTMFVIAGSLGALFGGRMGDIFSKRFPNSGRIVLAQISTGSAIPLAAVLLLVLPYDPSTVFMHGFVLFIMGFCIHWNSAATNNPIFAEIVPERARTTAYALDRSFESILASFAPPLVGFLAQHFYGYKPAPKGATKSVEVDRDRENAASLAKALYMAIGIPMSLCCLIYFFLYCTYPRDRDRALHAPIGNETEMQ
ncbi:hypothetical protein NE237_028961 [Protea cynaroides]|uniref:Major facilitator superfamily (MFS) profile domain-containing protein n=1 Tax=Protea cynaroides TaxID=273540 RepID=A0A9Q0JTD6_9MAGN|nr:hypothetical protein NE237_028961 [Protea cynaroides]